MLLLSIYHTARVPDCMAVQDIDDSTVLITRPFKDKYFK